MKVITPVRHSVGGSIRRLIAPSAAAVVVAVILASCGGGSNSSTPSTTTSPTATPTVASVKVTGPTEFAKPGDAGQFAATALLSNGTSLTVTNQAAWITSTDTVVTVSTTGRAVALGPGEADIQAYYEGVGGSARITVASATPPTPPTPTPPSPSPSPTPGCSYTISPSTLSLGATGSLAKATIQVTTTSNCSWAAAVADSWLSVTPRTGTGSAVLSLVATDNINSSAASRASRVTVGGSQVAVTQAGERPVTTPTPAPTPSPTPTPTPGCCRVCTTGKPCGDTCIASNLTCRTAPGCACAIASEDSFTALPWVNYSPALPGINYSPAAPPAIIPSREMRFEPR
jgi:hypothetical protein